MRTPIILSSLFIFALGAVTLALGYSYYDVKETSGLVQDPSGHPIPNAVLTAAGRSALSDDSGHFHLAIPRGTFQLTGFADGFGAAVGTIRAEDLFQKDYPVNLTLPPSEFRGTVRATDTLQLLPDATVQTTDDAPFKTDAQGAFVAQGLKNGTRLQISAPGYAAASFVYEAAGATEFVLAPALTHITVTEQGSQRPLANTLITAGDQSAQTDAGGQAVLRALATGVSISAQAPAHEPALVTYRGAGEISLALRANQLDGLVIDAASKKPIPNAIIFYQDQLLHSDAHGAYHLDKVPEEISLTVKATGYRVTSFNVKGTAQFDLALQPFKAKGIHLYYAMPRDDVLALLNRLVGTEVNTVLLDVKEGAGDIVWPSQVPLAQEINAFHARGIPPSELVQFCRAKKWYCIARMVIFKDYRLGQSHPELALHYPGGGVLLAGGDIWMNPAKKEVWDYDIALAKELSALGFDEVQFDYIRYPGNPTPLEFSTTETRLENIRAFLETAANALKPLPTFFSGDVFGLTTATKDEQGIGQRLEVDGRYFDYLSPMMYPSTWKGSPHLFQIGLRNPTCAAALACPYEIIKQGTLLARERTGGVLIRPWLQAYTDAGFGVPQYILQKKGAEDADSAGWLFWNNQGIYPDAMFDKAANGE